jgi:hypothetical protein
LANKKTFKQCIEIATCLSNLIWKRRERNSFLLEEQKAGGKGQSMQETIDYRFCDDKVGNGKL